MTTRIAALVAAMTLGAGAALAQMPDAPWTLEQLQTVYPDLTADTFATIDTSGDGTVDQAELDAAIAAGTLPASEG